MTGPECPYIPPSGFLRSTNLTRFCSVGREMVELWKWNPNEACWESLGTKTEPEWKIEAMLSTI